MKRILFLLSVLLILSLLLCACVDQDDETDPAELPELSGESAVPHGTEGKPDPAATNGDPQTPPDDSGEAADTGETAAPLDPDAPVDTGNPDLPPVETDGETEYQGLDVEEDYTVVVSENIGVGGN